jgi:hypothetical protein
MEAGIEIGGAIRKRHDDARWTVTGLHDDGTAYAERATPGFIEPAMITADKPEFWEARAGKQRDGVLGGAR